MKVICSVPAFMLVLLAMPVLGHDGAIQITGGPGNKTRPSWSPDGAQIAFEWAQLDSTGFWDYDIWVVPAMGGTATQITTDPGWDREPDWSPDGSQIAFESDRTGEYDIWVICVGGPSATETRTWGMIKSMFRD